VYSFRKQKSAAALSIAGDPPVGKQKNFSTKCVRGYSSEHRHIKWRRHIDTPSSVLGTVKGFFNKVIRKQECQSYKKEGTVKCCTKIE